MPSASGTPPTHMPVHLPGQSSSRVSLPGSLAAAAGLSGSALGSAQRVAPEPTHSSEREE